MTVLSETPVTIALVNSGQNLSSCHGPVLLCAVETTGLPAPIFCCVDNFGNKGKKTKGVFGHLWSFLNSFFNLMLFFLISILVLDHSCANIENVLIKLLQVGRGGRWKHREQNSNFPPEAGELLGNALNIYRF